MSKSVPHRALPKPGSRLLLALACGVSLTALGSTAAAAQEVVQALPDPVTAQLADALQRLSINPDSVLALTDAGRASLALNDIDAALGFFSRAQARDPNDGAMLAGLAQVAVRRGEADIALQLFENAEAAGFPMGGLAAERGLAHDLVGENARAQRLYRQALAREDNAETTRRLALSLAIAGDAAASEEVLMPLLQREDRAAFRTRAFALAILGRGEEAVEIADTMLPARLAAGLDPYFAYMPQLTRSQQAAAANQGRFPLVADIGRDNVRLAAMDRAGPPRRDTGAAATPDERLIPAGAPLGTPEIAPEIASAAPAPQPVVVATLATPNVPVPAANLPRVATPEAAVDIAQAAPPTVELDPPAAPVAVAVVQIDPPVVRQAAPPPAVVAVLEEVPPVVANAAPLSVAVSNPIPSPIEVVVLEPSVPAAPPPQVAVIEPPIVVRTIEPVAPPPPPAAPAPPPEVPPPEALADAFAEFAAPSRAAPITPAAGAVDITRIVPARAPPPPPPAPPPPPPPPPPAPPAHPARHWVQVATGQDTSAFRFDWRRLQREADGLLNNRQPFQARWGQSNRLVTGPFPSAAAANAFIAQLDDKGVDSFRFSSAAGEEVRPVQ